MNFTVYSGSPIDDYNNPLFGSSFAEEIELIKPMLLYANQIALVSSTAVLLEIVGTDNFINAAREEKSKNSEKFSNATKLAIKHLDSLAQLGKVGIVTPMVPNIAGAIERTNNKEFVRFLTDSNKEDIAEYFFLSAMISHIFDGTPVYSKSAHKLLMEYTEIAPRTAKASPTPKSTHLFNHLVLKLPNFQNTPVDEILDIRKELEEPLVRFRSVIMKYADEIKHIENDYDIKMACDELYHKEIEPALQDVVDATKTNSFMKNLGYSIFSDEGLLNRSLGGLTLGILTPGAIAAMSQSIPLGASAMIPAMVPAAAKLISKVAKVAEEHQDRKRAIEGNDLYFLHAAGKRFKK